MTNSSAWIESGGGPLVLVAVGDLSSWMGIDPVVGDTESDYDRACAVMETIAPVVVRGLPVVVVGDEPDRTAVRTFDALMYWVRWRAAPNEQALWDALDGAHLPGLDWTASGEFDAREGDYQLFDAAFSGKEIEDFLSVSMPPGRYAIETSPFKPSRDIEVLLHRFRKL